MSETGGATSASTEPILERVARESGVPGLFPPEVLRLHREGRAIRARKELLRSAREERNPEVAAARRRYAENLYLWQEAVSGAPGMYTLNGIGTRLVGVHEPTAEGTYIGTLCFTLVFVPVWPLAGYVVHPAREGRGWHFLARAPIPPRLAWIRKLTGAVVTALAVAIGWSAYWSGSHVDLHVYNGFDRPVVVTVEGEASRVPPRGHVVVTDLPAEETALSASWEGGAAPFEELEANLADHARETVVYNVAGRGVIRWEEIAYGDEEPEDGYFLSAGPLLYRAAVDYPFVDPPDSLSVREDDTAFRSLLFAADGGAPVMVVVSTLLDLGRADQALTVARAELTADPTNDELAWFTAQALLTGDREAQVALLRWCLERAPDAVELHRTYQALFPRPERDALKPEYAALLAENPQSAMHHYLAGRLERVGSDEALAHYSTALELEPDYPPAVRALAFRLQATGQVSEALTLYDRYASFGPEQASETLSDRVRLRRALDRDPADVEAVLAETAEAEPAQQPYVWVLQAHLGVERDPAAVVEEGATLSERLAELMEDGDAQAARSNLLADLRITAGDLAGARELLPTSPEEVDVDVAARLAFSDGATDEDRALLSGLLEAGAMPSATALSFSTVRVAPADHRLHQIYASSYGDLLDFLDAPDSLTNAARLAALTLDAPIEARAAAYLAAAIGLGERTDAGSRRARDEYLREARAISLPGELPLLRR